MKKNYTSPLFEEIVLMTEDVLSDISTFDRTGADDFTEISDEDEWNF